MERKKFTVAKIGHKKQEQQTGVPPDADLESGCGMAEPINAGHCPAGAFSYRAVGGPGDNRTIDRFFVDFQAIQIFLQEKFQVN